MKKPSRTEVTIATSYTGKQYICILIIHFQELKVVCASEHKLSLSENRSPSKHAGTNKQEYLHTDGTKINIVCPRITGKNLRVANFIIK